MINMRRVESGNILMGRLEHGSDLLESLNAICLQENIHLGRIEALGAVQKARIGFYNQQTREYQFSELDQPLEILKLTGNVSLRDGAPMVHAHITLADQEGKAHGGHLADGTIVFACEFILQVLHGPQFERGFDQETGLPLWALG